MPDSPTPNDIQYSSYETVAVNQSIFTGQQQVQDWGGHWLEATLTYTSMSAAQGAVLRDFMLSLKGQSNVFAFAGVNLIASVPATANATGYWALKGNNFKYGIKPGIIYNGFSLDVREAK